MFGNIPEEESFDVVIENITRPSLSVSGVQVVLW